MHKTTRVAVIVLFLVATVFAGWKVSANWWLVLGRKATEAERQMLWMGLVEENDSMGFVHRWRKTETNDVIPIGPFTKYYGKSDVANLRYRYSAAGDLIGSSFWRPDGTLEIQYRFEPKRETQRGPHWWWGERDQAKATADLRGAICSYLVNASENMEAIDQVSLDGLDLSGGNFFRADLDFATFRGTNVSGASFQEASVKGSDLSEAVGLTLKQVLEVRRWDWFTKFPEAIEKELKARGLR